MHMAEALAHGMTLADSSLEAALTPSAAQLTRELRAAQLQERLFWRNVVPLAATIENRRQLLITTLAKTTGRGPRFDDIVTAIGARLAEFQKAAAAALPNLESELGLRERPLREQWEARGPGILRCIADLTESGLLVEACEVLPVFPVLGGGGTAHLAYNSVRIEAVLANPIAELPEVVRLAWLIAQLQLDLPALSENIHAQRLPHIARFAMLPAALAAAQQVELVRNSPDLLGQAIESWRLAVPGGLNAVQVVAEWWEAYQATRPSFGVALAALDQMFG
jgi:hypothetical protein